MSNPNRRLQGDETLHGVNEAMPDATVLDFWRWAFGDICQNNLRGVFAEWLVAKLLAIDLLNPRDPWGAHDLVWRDGITIEVKSCAFLQAWHEEGHSRSQIGWSVPKTRTWSVDEGYSEMATHNADLYVLCVQIEQDPTCWNALDLGQWRFHVLTREQLASLDTTRITRSRLTQIAPELTASELAAAVKQVARHHGVQQSNVKSTSV